MKHLCGLFCVLALSASAMEYSFQESSEATLTVDISNRAQKPVSSWLFIANRSMDIPVKLPIDIQSGSFQHARQETITGNGMLEQNTPVNPSKFRFSRRNRIWMVRSKPASRNSATYGPQSGNLMVL